MILRGLNGDVVSDAVLWIEPEIGSGLEASAQADQHTLGDVLGGQSDLVDARAVHVEIERGQAEHLLHVDIGCSGNVAQFIGDFLADEVVGCDVLTDDLNVDRGGQSEIENLGDDVGGLEEKFDAGKTLRQLAAQAANVSRRGVMFFGVERDQYFRIARTDDSRVSVGEVDAGIGYADIVEHGLQLFLGNLVTQHSFDFIAQ